MADPSLKRRSALADVPLVSLPDRVAVTAAPDACRFLFRGGVDAVNACGKGLGFALPIQACLSSGKGSTSALWLGPDEWLIIGPDADTASLESTLKKSLQSHAHSLVDVSHRQVGLELTGTDAAQLLNSCCLLDLDIAAFPVGMCVRTVFGKAEIVLLRTDRNSFHLEVWNSFASYVGALLQEAAYGLSANYSMANPTGGGLLMTPRSEPHRIFSGELK